ncbi:MAG: cysteine synthase A [Oscillospiraceae bacterium]|nr:cysteine synthase A [Oscillospiraceae bacterium]
MSTVISSIEQLIGHTPLLRLERTERALGLHAQLWVKLEYLSAAGSVKDRVARAMLDEAQAQGLLPENAVIIEPSSGNTGVALAALAAARRYRCIIVMPESMSLERRKLIAAYGAEVLLTPGREGMAGAISRAEALAQTLPCAYIPAQFTNSANPAVHRATTGPEIWADTDGRINFFVAGVGTGGTITGAGEYLKDQNPTIRIVAVEPAASPVLSGGTRGAHGIQGIGAGFVPPLLNTAILDEIIVIDDAEAASAAQRLAHGEGLLPGISSGAALAAAIRLARRPENREKRIVTLLPDGGERYLSTGLFDA